MKRERLAPAVGFLLGAQFFFSCVDSTGKLLLQDYSIVAVTWLRYLAHFAGIALYAFWHFRGWPPRPKRPGLQIVRGLVLLAFAAFLFGALKHLPQAEAVAISFTAPLLILIAAGPVLGERVTRARWIAVVVGFIGMLIVVRPANALPWIGVAFGLATMASNATFQLLSRKLATIEDPIVTVFWAAMVGAIASSALAPLAPPDHWPTLGQALLFASFAITGTACHLLLIQAYRRAPASHLAPFIYCHIAFGALFGWLVFDQFPDAITLAGIAVIGASGAGIALYERMRSRALASAS